MSELINNDRKRKDLLKHMILQLHQGKAPEQVKAQLTRLLGEVPYGDVVAVEQELISEGIPQEEILKLCDLHATVLKGALDHTGAQTAPPGHPVHTFKQENRALEWELSSIQTISNQIADLADETDASGLFTKLKSHFFAVMDLEKHYQRKENLLFPFLEKHGITGPPTVMWGKHDETRELLKGAVAALESVSEIKADEAKTVIELLVKPASTSIEEMIYKEEEILFPMCLDTLTGSEWYQIYRQSPEIGFCLYDPQEQWQPEGLVVDKTGVTEGERIQMPTGSLTVAELNSILNTLPFDLTFVDNNDKVRYFTRGEERIFARNRAILGRAVQRCHPPASVHIVEQILNDFKSGRQSRAPFWINMGGRFIHIEYFAVRDETGNYLGTLEVSQDLTAKRALQGEQRLLTYAREEKKHGE